MILVDANILLYAYDSASLLHVAAKQWWEDRLSEPLPVRLSWVTVLAFLRISTHPRLLTTPFTMAEASSIVEEWFARPMVDYLQPTPRHWGILKDLLASGQTRGNLVTDAHLAALAIEHGATLCSTDEDFRRFPSLRWVNPLS